MRENSTAQCFSNTPVPTEGVGVIFLKSVSVDHVLVAPDNATQTVQSFLITVGCVVSVLPSLFRSTPTTGLVGPPLDPVHS